MVVTSPQSNNTLGLFAVVLPLYSIYFGPSSCSPASLVGTSCSQDSTIGGGEAGGAASSASGAFSFLEGLTASASKELDVAMAGAGCTVGKGLGTGCGWCDRQISEREMSNWGQVNLFDHHARKSQFGKLDLEGRESPKTRCTKLGFQIRKKPTSIR
jgi:hypothetical protein